MTDDDLHDRLDRLEAQSDENDTVLVIGGDPERAGWMSREEYEQRYSEAEREDHVGGESDG